MHTPPVLSILHSCDIVGLYSICIECVYLSSWLPGFLPQALTVSELLQCCTHLLVIIIW